MFKQISKCRICQNENLIDILNLGTQALSGIFPKNINEDVPGGALQLVKCVEDGSGNHCGLVQLKHNYNPAMLYGKDYGYRSSLNNSMVAHLHSKVAKILSLVKIEKNDYIIDIGSNDGTTLTGYPTDIGKLIGIDPTGNAFRKYYPSHIDLIADFFSSRIVKQFYPNIKAKVITSIAMFYDLENPLEFMQEIKEILSDDGIWVFEQSYLPSMLKNVSYDTVCHEHFEYYSLRQIAWMCERVGLKIIDVEFNEVNGGSFSITVSHENANIPVQKEKINQILEWEKQIGLHLNAVYQIFEKEVIQAQISLRHFLDWAKNENKNIYGLGASTKGNVILQYCSISPKDMISIGEVNQDKFGSFTPGSKIPIVPESEVLNAKADYLLVLPWHFKQAFINSEKYKKLLQKLIFPLPTLATANEPFVIPS